MNRNSIICQCNADPTVFFYFSGKDFNKKLGLYSIDGFTRENIFGENVGKSKLSFNPAKSEASNLIFSEESPIEQSNQFFPTFSWNSHSIVGAFTTGVSRDIKILSLDKGQLQVKEKIDIPNYFCSCIDINDNETFHLLASCNVEYSCSQQLTEGLISIIDTSTKQKIIDFQRSSSFETVNNVFGYPNNVKWVNSNCLVSGWKIGDFSSQLQFHDIRVRNSISVSSILTKCCEFLSVSQPGGHYLLSSNLNNVINVFDVRFMKSDQGQNTVQTVNCIYFSDYGIRGLQWFPSGKHNISIFTSDGIFITALNSQVYSHTSFEEVKSSKSYDSINIYWDEALQSHFEPLNLRDNFNEAFCWVNSPGSNRRHSIAYSTPESAYILSNLDIKINSFPSHTSFLSHKIEKRNKLQKSNFWTLNSSKLLGYSWIPYRIINYYRNYNKRIEEYGCIELLRRLEELNSAEARNLVIKQNDQDALTNIGIFPQANRNTTNIIKIIKSASHAFNYLSNLPNRIIYWKDLLKKFNNQGTNGDEKLRILDKLVFPGIRDLIHIFKYELGKGDVSTELKFIKVKYEDLEGRNCKSLNARDSLHIEIFSSTYREKLINFFGASSFIFEIPAYINKMDPFQLESFLISFFWNCITLQYQNFISFGDKLSKIFDNFIENENKLLKTSFLKNINLFFNSAGIFISNLYSSEDSNKISLSRKDIQFYYYSIISTSEHLLDENYYMTIWNSNIHLESTLQLSIRFIVAFSKFINIQEQSIQFSSYLLEELLTPSLGINSYIYIPANLLLLIGIYYLPMEEISSLIEAIIRKMAQSGFLDGISILGLNEFADETNLFKSLTENQSCERLDLVLRDININENVDSTFQESENNTSKNVSYNLSSQEILKQIFQKYLSLSFGDIQTVALIGSCIPNLPDSFNRNIELIKVCIYEYRNLLKNNSLIYYLINNSNTMNLSRNGTKSSKFTCNSVSSMLYELNILISSYNKIIHVDQDKLITPLPTGNVLFCYYCEQPLCQTNFEQSYLSDKSASNTDCNSMTPQTLNADLSEVQLDKKEVLVKNIYNRDSQVGYSLRRAGNNVTCINNLIQSEITQSLDSSSSILNCPNKYCNKPLPRCVICLTEISINMIGISMNDDALYKDCSQQSNKLNKWYTWCLHCHHGGCFKHISEWFECFDECPVPECNCWCNSVDSWYKL